MVADGYRPDRFDIIGSLSASPEWPSSCTPHVGADPERRGQRVRRDGYATLATTTKHERRQHRREITELPNALTAAQGRLLEFTRRHGPSLRASRALNHVFPLRA